MLLVCVEKILFKRNIRCVKFPWENRLRLEQHFFPFELVRILLFGVFALVSSIPVIGRCVFCRIFLLPFF